MSPQIDYTPPAAFAAQFDERRYRLVIDEAVRVLSKRFKIAFVKDAVAYIDDGSDSSSVNLNPMLAAIGHLRKDARLLDGAHAHTTRMLHALTAREQSEEKTFREVRRKLAVRLYPPDSKLGELTHIVTGEHLPGLVSMLMLDDEGAFSGISVEMLEKWSVTPEDAFREAIRNASRAKVDVRTLKPNTPSGRFPIYHISEPNHASSFALALPMFDRKYLGEFGALVAVPARELTLATPVGPNSLDDIVEAFVATIGGLVRSTYAQTDRPVSQDFYWLDPLGKFERIAVRREDGRVWALEPPRLTQMWDGDEEE